MRLPILTLLTCIALMPLGCDQAGPKGPVEVAEVPMDDGVEEIDWDALMPAHWHPEDLLGEYDLDELADDDPRAQELMERLGALWAEAPLVPELDGKRVRIPGFVVPLDQQGGRIGDFLLVPYYGACIHVPPPPANQTILVRLPPGLTFEGEVFDTVWVTGTLAVSPAKGELAEAGYRLEDATITPYQTDLDAE